MPPQAQATLTEALAIVTRLFGSNNMIRSEVLERLAYWFVQQHGQSRDCKAHSLLQSVRAVLQHARLRRGPGVCRRGHSHQVRTLC